MKKNVSTYTKENLTHIAFPLGGTGAGMFCLEGTGSLGKFSLRNQPDVNFEPCIFSALCIKGEDKSTAKIIEGQVPYYKIFGNSTSGGSTFGGPGNGLSGKNYGLPRFIDNDFESQFPFAYLNFADASIPLKVSLTGYSPFAPLDPDNSSLPVASLEYTFSNPTDKTVDAIYYINSLNFMDLHRREPELRAHILRKDNGFILTQSANEDEPHLQGSFYVAIDDSNAEVNTDWFNGGWFDVLTMQWNDIKAGRQNSGHQPDNLSPGGAVSVGFSLAPKESKKIVVKFAWYVPYTNIRIGAELPETEKSACCDDSSCCCDSADDYKYHKPFYTSIFGDVTEVMNYFSKKYDELYDISEKFSKALFSMTIPEAAIDAVAANLSILKSPTVLRQSDGNLWAWEGCHDASGCCHGSCTHVWNYAQSICHLFPSLERSLRNTEFKKSQNSDGHQQFRASLPIRETDHGFHAASDGQLGGIMKMYREWKISGDIKWLNSYYGSIKQSIDYCIRTWDKKEEGILREPHHNTYDIEFWGADGMCTSFYLGALKAFAEISEALSKDAAKYRELYKKGREYLETKLYNGEYFYQEAEWTTLEATFDISNERSPQVAKLLEIEGPKYQYKNGCLSDGILGAWLAKVCGLGEILDVEKVKSHLLAIHKYNYRESLIEHDNPQRPGYAVGDEGGLLLCSWPHDDKPSLPFVYSDEVWTGIEYQVAAHLISFGYIKEGMDIVEACRARYDGTKRNPYNEYECGHWYARAMASYSLIQAFSGIRYDAETRILYINNGLEDGFKSFLSTHTGYGTVEYKDGKVNIDAVYGTIKPEQIIFE